MFFSLSQSKLPGYVLPAIPPLALLCSIAAVRALNRSLRVNAVLAGILAATWILLVGAGFHGVRRLVGGNFSAGDTPAHVAFIRSLPLAGVIFAALIMIAVSFFQPSFGRYTDAGILPGGKCRTCELG